MKLVVPPLGLEPFPVVLKVGLKLGPGGGGTGGFGLRALLQANMPVAEAVTLAAGTGASAAAALGAIGLAEVAAPELPTSAVASAVAAEAPVAWTPAD